MFKHYAPAYIAKRKHKSWFQRISSTLSSTYGSTGPITGSLCLPAHRQKEKDSHQVRRELANRTVICYWPSTRNGQLEVWCQSTIFAGSLSSVYKLSSPNRGSKQRVSLLETHNYARKISWVPYYVLSKQLSLVQKMMKSLSSHLAVCLSDVLVQMLWFIGSDSQAPVQMP